MAKVTRRKDESVEDLIKRFKKKVTNEGILTELRRREYYLSPSEKRKEKSKQAQKKLRKYQLKQQVVDTEFY